jgi:hypothetical protein
MPAAKANMARRAPRSRKGRGILALPSGRSDGLGANRGGGRNRISLRRRLGETKIMFADREAGMLACVRSGRDPYANSARGRIGGMRGFLGRFFASVLLIAGLASGYAAAEVLTATLNATLTGDYHPGETATVSRTLYFDPYSSDLVGATATFNDPTAPTSGPISSATNDSTRTLLILDFQTSLCVRV